MGDTLDLTQVPGVCGTREECPASPWATSEGLALEVPAGVPPAVLQQAQVFGSL